MGSVTLTTAATTLRHRAAISSLPHCYESHAQCTTNRSSYASVAADRLGPDVDEEARSEVRRRQARLLWNVDGTERGAKADSERRGEIEEAVVDLERLGGTPLTSGLDRLDGWWELKYSTAADVTGILMAPSSFPLPILQEQDTLPALSYPCLPPTSENRRRHGAERGSVEPAGPAGMAMSLPPSLSSHAFDYAPFLPLAPFTLSSPPPAFCPHPLPSLTQDKEGASLIVTAEFDVRSGHSIL
ncbi:unnamed protein product [Closterium sp. NIES-53]